MTPIGQPERATQNRVIALFRDEVGYRTLGDWTDRANNSNIEESLLSAWLTRRGHTKPQIAIVLHHLRTEATNHNRSPRRDRGCCAPWCTSSAAAKWGISRVT